MRRIKVSEVQPGQQFSHTENNPYGDGFPALKLDQSQALRMFHKRKPPHGVFAVYYVFLPTGEISWTVEDSLVYVKA